MSDRTGRLVTPADLQALGLSANAAKQYANVGNRLERMLVEHGSSLAICDAGQLRTATTGWLAAVRTAQNQALCALPWVWQAIGRSDPPDRCEALGKRAYTPRPILERRRPLSEEQANSLDAGAIAVGGQPGLMVLASLHGDFTAGELRALRWEDLDPAGRVWWVRTDGARRAVPVTDRLLACLPAGRPTTGWAFPGADRSQPAGPHAINQRLATIAAAAGVTGVLPDAVRRTTPPAGVIPARPLSAERSAARSAKRGASGVTLSQLRAAGYSQRTAYLYAQALDQVAVQLAELGADLLTCTAEQLADASEGTADSHSMRGRVRSALKAGWDILGRDHTATLLRAVRVPPAPRGRCLALEPADASRLEQTAWGLDDPRGMVVLIALYTALRRFELAKLRWEDLRTDNAGRVRWLHVVGKGTVAADVPVHPVLAEYLAPRRGTGYLFPGRYSPHVQPNTVWAWVREVAELAGLDNVPTHRLRHTALATANDATGDLRTVQAFARHSRPETTAGYTRVAGARLEAVAAAIDYGRQATGGDTPDPADVLPGLTYRHVVEGIAGPRHAPSWVELGLAVHAAGGWRFSVLEEGQMTWTWAEHPELTASVPVPGVLTLYRTTGPDEAEAWDLHSGAQLVALAVALAAGAPAPPATVLDATVEAPFVDWLNGGPLPDALAAPNLRALSS